MEAHKADLSDLHANKYAVGNPPPGQRIGDQGPMGRILILVSHASGPPPRGQGGRGAGVPQTEGARAAGRQGLRPVCPGSAAGVRGLLRQLAPRRRWMPPLRLLPPSLPTQPP
jgi:hypothetical protein